MATTHSTTPRTVYQSLCGRVTVVRDGPKDYSLHLDGVYTRSYERSWDAEHDGGVWLHEQAEHATPTHEAPEALTLAHFCGRHRTEFDNSTIHETEGRLYRAMARMGLSDDAMHDLFGHVVDLVDTMHIQAGMDGYTGGLQAAMREVVGGSHVDS